MTENEQGATGLACLLSFCTTVAAGMSFDAGKMGLSFACSVLAVLCAGIACVIFGGSKA